MKKVIFSLLTFTACAIMLPGTPLLAQSESKLSRNTEKVNSKSRQLEAESENLQIKAQETAGHVQRTTQNVKNIVKLFEPIFKFHLKPKQIVEHATVADSPVPASAPEESVSNQEIMPTKDASDDSSSEVGYSPDGTAFFGSQNHQEYGCYLDISTGTVMDDVDASTQTGSVDLIFTATDHFGSAPMYAFLSPALAKNDFFANYYFRGSKYKDQNIPVKEWEDVNESEIALTKLTLAQFEKIQNNQQLQAVIKQAGVFKDRLESRTKLTGKVIAVKTHVAHREAYGLIAIMDHFGTTGSNGCLKIKIKVTGFDQNADGIPEAETYLK